MNTDQPLSSWQVDFSKRLGLISLTMSECKHYRAMQFFSLREWIIPPILHGNEMVFIRQETGFVDGFMTWAEVNEDTLFSILNDSNYVLRPSEWKEGNNLVIMDFSIRYNLLFRKVRELLKNPNLGLYKSAYSIKRDLDGNITKIYKWK
ncbi:toxin-activating lysine-acyltransferase [Enterovibrio norvegicus]|uniref:toxin-activating lysine-acyltransferase n=1 Tax=Enterovibrio norvegicus TaxID=188144 RepID=UPI003551DE12